MKLKFGNVFVGFRGGMPETRHFLAYATQVVEAISRARIGWSVRKTASQKPHPIERFFQNVQLIAELRSKDGCALVPDEETGQAQHGLLSYCL